MTHLRRVRVRRVGVRRVTMRRVRVRRVLHTTEIVRCNGDDPT